MISPLDIRDRARRFWDSGRPLRAWLGAEALFPYNISFRKPSSQEWLEQFAHLREATEQLERQSRTALGYGYSLTFSEISHQKLGHLRIPERISFDTATDLAAYIGETATLERFQRLTLLVRSREPRLEKWLTARPLRALESETVLSRLLTVVDYFQAHPRPQRYARELGIPGVDSKFIEDNRSTLSEWFDLLLPPDAIDATVRGIADGAFERRYGLKLEDPRIRFRWVDPRCTLAGSLRDAAVPVSQFAAYAPACGKVIITENKINYLTFPPTSGSIAIFGGGYAIDLIKQIPWIGERALYYWGDLDTHGFSILSRLRGHWPQACSFLMDRRTLMEHEEFWTAEPADGRCLVELPNLTGAEHDLYDDLRFDRLGECVRLEQERIGYLAVEAAASSLT